jgi:hypothetical protein
MEIPDLGKMEEVRCPDCNGPIVILRVEGKPSTFEMSGCRCGRAGLILPDAIFAGFGDGPFFIYKAKA